MQRGHKINKEFFLINFLKKTGAAEWQFFFILLLFFSIQTFSQGQIITEEIVQKEIREKVRRGALDYSAEINLEGIISTDGDLPFWMHHNTRGRIRKETNIATLFSGKVNYNFSDAYLEMGSEVLLQDVLYDQFHISELYAHFTTLDFYLTAGKRHQKQLYNGLSSSNRSILYSLNAPPMPGLEFGTVKPVFFSGESGLGIEGSWNGYVMEEDRHVRFARVHRVNLLMVYRNSNNFQIKAGIHHFAQWGGVSKTEGRQPGSAIDYLRIITGSSGGSRATTIDQTGVLGNHLGSYELILQKDFPNVYLEFFYNYIYEDDNRMGFSNFPDGRYGMFVRFQEEQRIIDKVMYEFTFTRGQSYKSSNKYSQNYFSNGVYRNGWAYYDRILGSPFFTYDEINNRVVNNKFAMHHLGISGKFSSYFKSLDYKLKMSYGRNDGTFDNPYVPSRNVFYWSYEMPLLLNFVELNFKVAGEYSSTQNSNHALGIQLVKKF